VLAQPPSLAAALDLTEALILHLARVADDDGADPGQPGYAAVPAALFAGPEPGDQGRLRGITAAGQDLGLIVVILGTWTYGTTCHVAADGTITAATPPGSDLEGVRLFQLAPRDLAGVAAAIGEQDQAARPPDVPVAAGEPAIRQAPAADDGSPGSAAGQEARPVRVSVLGPLQISAWDEEISTGFRKARELLAFLAVCGPQGASSDTVTEALWPGTTRSHGDRQRNLTLRKARDMLRARTGAASAMWILFSSDRYRLDQDLISADLWEFRAALDAAREAAGDTARLAACRLAAGLYRGPLCEGAGYEWAEPFAEAARRSVLDARTRIAEILQDSDPEQALAALEAAAADDPHNEDTYLRIMGLQAAAGRADAARRTYQLLLSRLAEIDLTGPRPAIRRAAAEMLGETGPQPTTTAPATARRGR
jgi:DNA-binding SARP family transcriptional activator